MIPSQVLSILSLLGDAQGQSTILLSNAYSSSGSSNVYADKLGRIRTVDGYTRQNSSALTTNTGASAAMVKGLYMFKKTAAGSTTRQLIVVIDDQTNEWEIHYSTDLGATFTFIVDLGAGSINTFPDFALFGDELFITNGVMAPRMWNGTSISSVGATQLGAPTLSDGGPGQLNGSGYKYRLVPIKANKVRKPGSAPSASLDVQNRRITVSWTADADTDVLGYELWRTTGSGLDFFLVIYIDGRTTATYTDTLPDSEIILRPALSVVAAHGDAPPTGAYFCEPHKGRMWWFRTDTFPRRAWWSDPGDADSVYMDRNYVELTDSLTLGDVGTGATGEFEGSIILWCDKSVWRVSGTGRIINNELDWRRTRLDAKTGTVSHRTVVRVPAGSVYSDQEGRLQKTADSSLAYLTPELDIRLLDKDGNDTIISFPKNDTLKSITSASANASFAYDDVARGMFIWHVPVGASVPNTAVAWSYWYGLWFEFSIGVFGSATPAESSSASVVLTGQGATATGALIYKMWTGDNLDGSSITGTMMTKPIYPPVADGGPPDYTREKRLVSALPLFLKDASPTTITLSVLSHDAADGDTPSVSRSITGTSRKFVPVRQTTTGTNPGKHFHGPGFRMKLTSTATSGSWTLQSLLINYQALEGQTR